MLFFMSARNCMLSRGDFCSSVARCASASSISFNFAILLSYSVPSLPVMFLFINITPCAA